jgi:hypothetical protein
MLATVIWYVILYTGALSFGVWDWRLKFFYDFLIVFGFMLA